VQLDENAQRPQSQVEHPRHAAKQQHLVRHEVIRTGARDEQAEGGVADIERDHRGPALPETGDVHRAAVQLRLGHERGGLVVVAQADHGECGVRAEEHPDLRVEGFQDAFHGRAEGTDLVSLLGEYREELDELRGAP